MNLAGFLNDPVLCGVSALLILLWSGAQFRLYSLPRLDGGAALATLLRIACGFLLAGASLDKLGDAAGFLEEIKECYFVIPDSLQSLTAVVVPWLEFFTGLCLVTGIRWRAAALVFCGLMAVYSLVIFSDVLQGIDCNCGCFDKTSKEKMTWLTVLRDLLFLGMGLIVLTRPRTYLSPERSSLKKYIEALMGDHGPPG